MRMRRIRRLDEPSVLKSSSLETKESMLKEASSKSAPASIPPYLSFTCESSVSSHPVSDLSSSTESHDATHSETNRFSENALSIDNDPSIDDFRVDQESSIQDPFTNNKGVYDSIDCSDVRIILNNANDSDQKEKREIFHSDLYIPKANTFKPVGQTKSVKAKTDDSIHPKFETLKKKNEDFSGNALFFFTD